MKVHKVVSPSVARKAAYEDTGEQLDAIYKGFMHLASQGIDIGKDAQDWVDRRTAVKLKFKKI